MRYEELTIEGRNAVLEAFRSGKTIDKVFVLDGSQDGPIRTIVREAKKTDAIINFVKKERLDQMSETGKHQGVIAYAAAYEYGTVEEMLQSAEEKQEPPFLILLDNIEDPHNLGSILRTANQDISNDFSLIYFSCIQIWFSTFDDYISKNMAFSVLILVA